MFIKLESKNPKLIIAAPSKNIVSLAEKYLNKIGCNVKVAEYINGLEIEDIKNYSIRERWRI